MASSVALSIEDHGPKIPDANCRVNRPHTCQLMGFNRWGKDFGSTTRYKDVTSYQNGMTIYRPNDGLRVPQQQAYLTPEYFDGGCYQIYCPRKEVCPEGTLSGPTKSETKMFDYQFASRDPYLMDGGPLSCAGVKGASANSFLGWTVIPPSDKPVWMVDNEIDAQSLRGGMGRCGHINY